MINDMKKTSYIKSALLQVGFVTTILLISSCSYTQKPEDSKVAAEDQNKERFDQNNLEKDAQFLVDAAEINLKQIQLGQLAQQRGITAHVKELGEKMVVTHTKSQSDLIALARSKSITIPTSPTDDTQDDYTRLNDKSGNDFDKAYADMMVNRHKDAISSFEKATTERNDADIKNWAIATLPDLRTNLNYAVECQKKCEKL
jgi:putative membrane protein